MQVGLKMHPCNQKMYQVANLQLPKKVFSYLTCNHFTGSQLPSSTQLKYSIAMASTYPHHWLCCLFTRSYCYLVIAEFLFLLASLPLKTNSLSFEFTSFNQSSPGVELQGDASISNSRIEITKNEIADSIIANYGRALYPKGVQLWDAGTKRLTDFSTNFTFSTAHAFSRGQGDGLAFLLVPEGSPIPGDSFGRCLGLFSHLENTTKCALNQTIVAVEFDTFQNYFDPSDDHIGIDINSIVSTAYVNVSAGLKNKTAQAFVSYDSTTKNLSVFLSIINESSVPYSVSLSHTIDLSTVLPERVQVGFSASTGTNTELHEILDWSFNSTLEEVVAPSPSPTLQHGGTQGRRGGLVAGIGVSVFLILIFGISIAWIRLKRKSRREGSIESDEFNIDNGFDQEVGPKRFAYSELSRATNNFCIKRKLGEGGFGAVYKGILTGHGSREVAVKKIKSGSRQGKREYVSEVKIISRLRHRNLVQLLGWCHDNGELLLVYEFMPNGSLDFHLFGREMVLLPWQTRYKIALGLASAVLYLHEEWEQSVIHRDIKSRNVMLDSNFTPKLGDFGLARLADHDVGLQTTAPAGTQGYLAPECLLTRKVSKESDVYSFGVVALEIACGKPVIEKEQAREVNLAEWVWGLYGEGLILDAVDSRLEGEFDEQQAECLMVVGLWCSHPYVRYRPSIKEAIAVLNFEAPLPGLPPQFPVPRYDSINTNSSLSSSQLSSL